MVKSIQGVSNSAFTNPCLRQGLVKEWFTASSKMLIITLLCIFALPWAGHIGFAQTATDSLKTELARITGTNRVDILNQISKRNEYSNPDSSFYYASQAEVLAAELNYKTGQALAVLNIGNYYLRINNYQKAIEAYDLAIVLYKEEDDKDGLQKTLNNKGNVLRIMGDYDQALFNFLESMKICVELDNQKGIAYASLNIGLIYSTRRGESESLGLPYFLEALEICREINDQRCVAYAINNIALVYAVLEDYDKALDYHRQSLELKQAAGDKDGIASSLGNISDIYTLKDDYENSLKYNRQALEIYREINDLFGVVHSSLDMAKVYLYMGKDDLAVPFLDEALLISEDINSLQLKSGTYRYLYDYHLARKDFEQALEFYRRYTTVEDSIYSENSNDQIAQMRTLYETEKKEAVINQMTNEKTIQDLKLKKSEQMKWFFIVALILTLLLAGFVYFGYRQKRKANILLEERNRFEIENKKRAISLFGQQVSREVALELLSDTFKSGSKKLFACIMFLDIRDFTAYAEDKEPGDIIQYQNDVFGFMIDLISKYHGIINQFLGDGFMATFGAPASSGNDCQNAVNASLEIVTLLRGKCESGEIPHTKVGIGLHAGHIVTGNVGTAERKQYSITGNTVILASRLEQLNKKFNSEILISKEVLENLDQKSMKTESLGVVNLKGRAEPMEIIRLM
nr:tetratricopeptide repeat protein [Bacteroidota bacterium]